MRSTYFRLLRPGIFIAIFYSDHSNGMCLDDGTCSSKKGKCMGIPLPKHVEKYHPDGSNFVATKKNITKGCSKISDEGSEIECACVGKKMTLQ